ncbi:MAG: cytochrome c biogenesis protein CcdA, partial [Planctomycetota bacterium]
MRTTERRAAFPRFLHLALLTAALLGCVLAPSRASAQVPPKIPGLPGFGKQAAAVEEPPLYNDSRDRVDLAVSVAVPVVEPGGDTPVAIVFTLDDHWHIWPKPGPIGGGLAEFGSSIRTEIALKEGFDPASVPVEAHLAFAQWPVPVGVEFDLGEGPLSYAVHEGAVRVFVPMSVAKDAKPGRYEIPLTATFQACDDTGCLRPVTVDLPVTVEVGPSIAHATGAEFDDFDRGVYARIRSVEKPSELLEFNLFSWKFSIDPRGAGLILLLAIAAAGGFILNFTPCVLPVIPLKIMGLAQAAQGSRAKCFALGFTMSLGVVAFWMLLGTLMATVQGFTSANQLFQMPWFTILVGVVISAMAIGMAGFFSVKLPDWVYMVEAKHDSYGGSFLFGIMTAVLSTPCTAPLMGTAVAWSTTQGVATILTVFAAVGVGMALPYLVLSAYPNLVDRMPRSGPSSDLIKQVMGLLLLAAGAYFAGAGISGLLVTPPEPPSKAYWWAVTVLGTAAGAWLLWRGFRIAAARWPLAVALIIVVWAFLAGASLFLTALLGAM